MNAVTKFCGFRLAVVALFLGLASQASSQDLPTAQQLAASMTIGWNLGNTMEPPSGEGTWAPAAHQQLIDSVKAAGFNTVRLPVAWDSHANQTTLVIDAAWMARVKEVVDYCINRDLYVILNIHWDGGWLEKNVNTGSQSAVNNKQQNYWTQIANFFKDYDEHLIFAGTNEPDVADATGMAVLLSYHQTFINAVRATGGRNGSRVLIVQGPSTDIEKTNNLMNTMPTDQIANRLMVEVHYYSPSQFAILGQDGAESWAKMYYYWGQPNHNGADPTRNPTWGEENYLDSTFQLMKAKFVDKGIPVLLGEFSATMRTGLTGTSLDLHKASRLYYHRYVVNSAMQHGMIPVYWDNGHTENGQIGNLSCALFDRNTGAFVDKESVQNMMDVMGITIPQPVPVLAPIPLKGKALRTLSSRDGEIRLGFANPQLVEGITVYNLHGQLVAVIPKEMVGATVQMGSHWNSGLYIVRIQTKSGLESYRALKE